MLNYYNPHVYAYLNAKLKLTVELLRFLHYLYNNNNNILQTTSEYYFTYSITILLFIYNNYVYTPKPREKLFVYREKENKLVYSKLNHKYTVGTFAGLTKMSLNFIFLKVLRYIL